MKKRHFLPFMLVTANAYAAVLMPQIEHAEAILESQPEQAKILLPPLLAKRDNMSDQERWRLDWLEERYGFHLENIDIDREQDKADVCLRFNRAVAPQPVQDWAGKISITPAPDGGLRYLDNQLCFSGNWASTYQIHINADLQSDNGVPLDNPVEREIATGNREPMLRFAAQGSVLALEGDRNIALESVNTGNIRLQLWFFPREGLANETLRSALLNPQQSGYWLDFKDETWLRERASHIYSGSFDIANQSDNTVATSSVHFSDMLGDNVPDTDGFYLLNVWDGTSGSSSDTQTLVFTLSKTGLSAYQTEEGLWVEARNLRDTTVLTGLDVALYAKSGALIARAKSDERGMAHFSRAQISGKDGDAPAHLIAESPDGRHGITYLAVDGPGFDLADKGLQGDGISSPLRYWSWIDRGVYRPGETLHALWIVKNRDLSAYNTPLWLSIRRPDGTEMESRSISPDESGAYLADYTLAENAALGNWSIALRLGRDGEYIASDTVRIDSILPQTLEADLTRPVAPHAGENTTYRLSADWLYGAPAANIRVESSYRTGNAEGNAMPGWEGWQIGRHDDNTPPVFHNGSDTALATDAEGKADIPVFMPENHSTRPQSIRLTATLSPQGGRPLSVSTEDRIRRKLPYAAVKSEGQGAQIALVNDAGELQAGELAWTLYDLKYHYYWYRQDGEWHLRENITRAASDSGTLTVDTRAPATLNLPAGDDYHPRELEVRGDNNAVAASIHLGYRPDGDGTAPDRIRFAENDHAPYRKGDNVTVRLFAPFDGTGSVHLATDGIIDTIPVTFRDGAADISFSWQQWDSGLWLLAGAYNADQSGARNRRAVGLTWLGADTTEHRLPLTADIPDTVEPGHDLTLTFNGEGWVNVAVIDDGLYQLARATFGNPLDAFFGKKRLPLSLYDVWGSVIRQLGGDPVKLRSGADGGDEELSSALVDLPDIDMRNFIRYWSKPVQLQGGKATVTLPVPEGFNGRLRVMAANYDDRRLGHLEKTLTVRAPLVTDLRSPAYLTVGDQGSFHLHLHNTTDAEQTVNIAVDGGHLQLENAAQTLTLAAGKAELLAIPFSVKASGETTLTANIDAGGRSYVLSRNLTLRSAVLPRYHTRLTLLKPDESLMLDLAAGSILHPASSLPWSAETLAEALRRYPYSCSEQLTGRLTASRADARLAPDDANKQAVFRDQYNTLLNRQTRSGAFSLWGGGQEELWLSAYAGETVLAEGGEPPFADGSPQARLLQFLRNAVLQNREESDFAGYPDGIAYAHLLLARNGQDLRGALLNDSERLPKVLPLSPATLNFALAFVAYGDVERGEAILQRIDTGLEIPARRYGSPLAQSAELLVRLHEWQQAVPDKADAVAAWQESTIKAIAGSNSSYLSTQEQSWLLRAAHLYADQVPHVTANGKALAQQKIGKNDRRIVLHNPAAIAQYITVSELHYPPAEQAESKGWQMSVRYEDTAGKALDPAALPLHSDILAHVELKRNYAQAADIIFTCPLPAGVQAVDTGGEPLADFADKPWYDTLSIPQMTENRDDRHIAAFRLEQTDDTVRHTYLLKAVRAGQWHAPGCQVEDMYRPQNFARDKAQTFRIR